MITTRRIGIKKMIRWSGKYMLWLIAWMALIAFLYKTETITFNMPWLPISVIATAVAFYLGFKNNSSYDRMWEARKVWGAIVNSSRAWGNYVSSYVSNQFKKDKVTNEELHQIKKRLIYRHIAWLYALRSQLLQLTEWEHAKQKGVIGKSAKKHIKEFGVGLVDDEVTDIQLHQFLPADECEKLINYKNTATQIINHQGLDMAKLREDDFIDDFRHVELQKVLYDFYIHQGKLERIKKFPLPRQYANMSIYFVAIFIFLLPFGLIPPLMALGTWGFWLSVPITAIVGWVYVMMEVVGDYSENPFQQMANDIPMLSLTRVIEIDLREMLGETDLPPNIESKDGVLM